MSTFGRTVKMENLFGNDPRWKFENAYFEEEAPDMVTAIEMVEQDIKVYVKNKKEQMKKKENQDEPFPDNLHNKR